MTSTQIQILGILLNVASKIDNHIREAKRTRTGFSLDRQGEPITFKTGFVVSVPIVKDGQAQWADLLDKLVKTCVNSFHRDVGHKQLTKLAQEFLQNLAQNGNLVFPLTPVFGAWFDGETVIFDVGYIVENKARAVRLGKKYRQKVIWDLANSQEIYLQKRAN